ncbi:MAG: SDR family NAD(P)-dependent oxidoreductase [Sphingobacteriales bacterium]|nr:SDR family NAD(P)-dependent oxidoreductase [Sphingobacteriales bacterium]
MNFNPKLKGQSALVTGANSGIGKAVAIALGNDGANVAVNFVSHPEAAQAVVDEIKANGGNAIAIQADVSKEDQVQAMFQAMFQEFGTIDILVNNAGLQKDAAFQDMTLADWQLVIDINLTGQFLCAREAVREFVKRGVIPERSKAAGKIICMSSVHEVIPWGGHANYASSKGGVMLLMKSMEKKITAEHIRLEENLHKEIPLEKWGPYLSERQWGTVREDYSAGGDAWNYLSHDQARSRVYRWGEDGLAGISDYMQNLCFAIALWNGKDSILKERLFGLSNGQGNHGEDVKELYYYLDNVPTHYYMKYLYKYPQEAFPYQDIVNKNRGLPLF